MKNTEVTHINKEDELRFKKCTFVEDYVYESRLADEFDKRLKKESKKKK